MSTTYWGSKRLAKHPLRLGIGTITNACNIYLYVHKATNWIILQFMEIFFMPPKGFIQFPWTHSQETPTPHGNFTSWWAPILRAAITQSQTGHVIT